MAKQHYSFTADDDLPDELVSDSGESYIEQKWAETMQELRSPRRKVNVLVSGNPLDGTAIYEERDLNDINPQETAKPAKKPKETKPKKAASPKPAANGSADDVLDALGLGFIRTEALPGEIPVHLRLSGTIHLSIPLWCHHYILTEQLVVLVSDSRRNGTNTGIQISEGLSTELVLPDETVPIIPPMPSPVSFDVGVLKFLLFLRLPGQGDSPELVE